MQPAAPGRNHRIVQIRYEWRRAAVHRAAVIGSHASGGFFLDLFLFVQDWLDSRVLHAEMTAFGSMSGRTLAWRVAACTCKEGVASA